MKLRRGAESLSRAERLRGKRDFSRIFREGEWVRLKGLSVRWITNSLQWSRMGTSVGRRFGNAVRRNRARRVLKELYRTRKDQFPQGIDMVFMPQRGFLEHDRVWQEKTFATAARRINSSYRRMQQAKNGETVNQ